MKKLLWIVVLGLLLFSNTSSAKIINLKCTLFLGNDENTSNFDIDTANESYTFFEDRVAFSKPFGPTGADDLINKKAARMQFNEINRNTGVWTTKITDIITVDELQKFINEKYMPDMKADPPKLKMVVKGFCINRNINSKKIF